MGRKDQHLRAARVCEGVFALRGGMPEYLKAVLTH